MLVERTLYEDGATRSTLRLVQQWARAGVPVQLFVLQRAGGGRGAPLPAGVEPTYPARPGARLRWVLAVGLLRLVVLARRADVVVSGREIGWGLLVARAASWLARRPFVVVVRAAPGDAIDHYVQPRLRAAVRRALRTADRVVCITPGLVPAVLALGVPGDRAVVALNGVEVDRVVATAPAPAAALPRGEGPLVVGVGRLSHQKGFDVLLRAHAAVVASGRPHRLLLVGEGPDRASLERLAAELGVADSLHLPGFVDDPLPLLAAADLFCLPSRWEGFGQSLAEALLLAVPAVAADCVSGPRLLLAGGEHGDLVPVDDVAALANAVSRHLDAPERLRAAAARGRAWAVAHLGVERAAGEVLEVLHDAAARGRRRGLAP